MVQPAAVRAMLEKAHAADRFRKNCGRAHPLWGNGSLMAAALTECGRAGEPRLSDPGDPVFFHYRVGPSGGAWDPVDDRAFVLVIAAGEDLAARANPSTGFTEVVWN